MYSVQCTNKVTTLLRAFKVSLQVKGPVSLIISLLGFFAALLPVISAELLAKLTDELQLLMGSGGSVDPALTVFASLVGLYVAQLIIPNLAQWNDAMDAYKVERFIKRTLLKVKCGVRYPYIENHDDFQKRIAFVDEYAGYTMAQSISGMITNLQLLVSFFFSAFALLGVSPVIVAVLVVTSIPAAVLAYNQQDETLRHRAKWMEEGAMAIHYFHMLGQGGESLSGLQEIRHLALFDYLKARWRAIADEYIGKKNAVMAKHVRHNSIADLLRSAVYMGILLIAAWRIYQDPSLGLGVFTLVFALSGQLQRVTGDFMVGVMVLAQHIPYMKAFFDLEELAREPRSEKAEALASGDIEFDDVSFAYPGADFKALKHISVKIKDGEKIAIVGENGSGKSTFISLLTGMFDPESGSIRVGNRDLAEGAASIRESISVVFQDFAHYEASLRDNITVSDRRRKADDREIMELAERVHVDDVIREQPQGLDELVGSFSEKANNLSGGQWQKISIARAAYKKDAKIMILDEPTAALDPVAEAELYRDFAALTGDKTTILISHRLGITAVVDRILVFESGEIIEDGTHRQLMAKDGRYAKMYRAQAQWYAQ